ncbi:MAG: leucyl aminopeptidase [Deltaproteobacteria bacterium]|nr:MAG: leucyl aminopeptidase [Deltaproteobacteria bacterium]
MLKAISLSSAAVKADLLVIPVTEKKRIIDDPALKPLIEKAKTAAGFNGASGQQLTLYSQDGFNAPQLLFLGMGKTADLTAESFRGFAGNAIGIARERELSNIAFAVPTPNKTPIDWRDLGQGMMEGALLANQSTLETKKTKKNKPVSSIAFVSTPGMAKRFENIFSDVTALTDAVLAARQWVNTPSNAKRPEMLAELLANAGTAAGLTVTVLNEKTLKKKKFHAMLAVAQGSTQNPRLVIMTYTPKRQTDETIALVGKGITFDSGGLNLKPSGSMETMKLDMAGGAAVAGALLAIAKLKPRKQVIGIIPIAENMPSGNAYRPGDVLKTLAGKTIEVSNTDAEGRLLLIDAMAYAVKTYAPDLMIDVATLTGACVVALGEKIAGVFGNDDALTAAIAAAGKAVHEPCWVMPMPDEYKAMLKSDVADLSTTGGRFGGSITAALFLSEFVGTTRWAHIDIAGPAFGKKSSAYCAPGGTGFGVRLLTRLIQNLNILPSKRKEEAPAETDARDE